MVPSQLFLLLVIALQLFEEGFSIWCYSCYSGQTGCGAKIDWYLQGQKARWCNDMCVKMEDRKGSVVEMIRGCLTDIEAQTMYRTDIPSLRRHGYCLPAKSNVETGVADKFRQYCFCNDWNYCNKATPSAMQSNLSMLHLLVLGTLTKLLSAHS